MLCVACGVGGVAVNRSRQASTSQAEAGPKPEPSSAATLAGVDAGPPDRSGDPDDIAAIQQLLRMGHVVKLRSGATYHISRRVDVTVSGSGIVSEGAPATLELKDSFNNVNGDEVYELGVRSDSIGIYVGDDVSGVTLENLVIRKDVSDGTYVTAIAVRGASHSILQKLDISGFSLGAIVSLDSVDSVVVKDTYIHDSWANRYFLAPDKNELTKFPQLTGIVVDDNKLSDAGRPRVSRNLSIVDNTIRRLRFGRDLYSRPRICFRGTGVSVEHCAKETLASLTAYCVDHPCSIMHYQTDGITVGSPGSNFLVAGNTIDTVGEGIDLIDNNGTRVIGNTISNALAFGIKLVHGSTKLLVEKNVVNNAGIANILVAGTSSESFGNTAGNVMRLNRMSGVGNIGAYCQASIPAPFRIVDDCSGLTKDAAAIEVSPNNKCANDGAECPYGIPKFNFFFQNHIEAAPTDTNMGSAVELQERVADNVFYGNVFDDASGRNIRYAERSTWVGSGNVIDAQGPDELVIGDVNGDQKPDTLFRWKASGRSDLYRSRADGSFDIVKEAPVAAPR